MVNLAENSREGKTAPGDTPWSSSSGGSTPVAAIRGGALGDFVVTLPALRRLRQRHDGTDLFLIARSGVAPLADPRWTVDHDGLGMAPLYLPGCPELPARLRPLESSPCLLTYAVDPEGVLQANLRRLLPGRVLVHDPRPPDGFAGHVTDHLMAPLAGPDLPLAPEDVEPRIRVEPEEASRAAAWLESSGLSAPLVALHPGSGATRKNWPLDRFAALADRLHERGLRPVWSLGPLEERVRAVAGCRPCLPAVTVRELAAFLAQVDLFIGNDSGPGHLAAAVGTRTLSLFGPTDPVLWRPRSRLGRVLQAPGGRLEYLAVDAVVQAVLACLEEESGADR